MHAGVGATAPARIRRTGIEREDGASQRLLDGARILLRRPTGERSAVIGNGEEHAVLAQAARNGRLRHPPPAGASVGPPSTIGMRGSSSGGGPPAPVTSVGAATQVLSEQTLERQ